MFLHEKSHRFGNVKGTDSAQARFLPIFNQAWRLRPEPCLRGGASDARLGRYCSGGHPLKHGADSKLNAGVRDLCGDEDIGHGAEISTAPYRIDAASAEQNDLELRIGEPNRTRPDANRRHGS